jgi:hypothetical protein
MAHQLLKKHNIKHLMLTHEPDYYSKYMDEENLLWFSWGELSIEFPDDLPSWHTSSQGHIKAYSMVLDKLKENGWA